ncbi:hypothetical protein DRP04_15255 [Archaeoglobales archaeon]|nr:MAG: hypothetical protein DRP04_15255 [Archaeoglobales archaeon]
MGSRTRGRIPPLGVVCEPTVKDGVVTFPSDFPKKKEFPWDAFGGYFWIPPAGTEYAYCCPFIVEPSCMWGLGGDADYIFYGMCFEDQAEDETIESYLVGSETTWNAGRVQVRANGNVDRYAQKLYPAGATEDHYVDKIVAGTWTKIAAESVDLREDKPQRLKLTITGNTIEAYRGDMESPKLTVTDTDIVGLGHWGVFAYALDYCVVWWSKLYDNPMLSKSNPNNKCRWYLLPLIGKGTEDDPIRPKLPERIKGRVNELAVNWSAIIPCRSKDDGRPKFSFALVVVGTKSQEKLNEIETLIEEELRKNIKFRDDTYKIMRGEYTNNYRLKKEDARAIGKRMNPKLPEDFVERMMNMEVKD